MSDYFRLGEKEQLRFYRLPKALFGSEYRAVSADAKLLYGLLYDRMDLSRLNKWTDEYGRLYVHFTINNAAELLGFSRGKTCRLFAELEANDLISRRRQGLGKPDVIYARKLNASESEFLCSQNKNSGGTENGILECAKPDANDTEINETEYIETYLSSDEMERRIREQIEYDILCEKEPAERLDELVCIIGQVMSVRSPTMTIHGSKYTADYVKDRFRKLRGQHIEYVLDCMDSNTGRIKKMSSYLIAALFNAPATIDSYYHSEVNHDMAEWCSG